MAKPLRIEYEGNERRKIYFSKTDYEQFLNYTAEARNRKRVAAIERRLSHVKGRPHCFT